MKALLLLASALLMGSSAFAQFSGRQICDCVELQRRIDGLRYVANSPYVSGYDRQDTGYASNRGENFLQRSYNTSDYNQKQSICTQGNQSINPQWVRWQAWIAQNGADERNLCY